jgi:hypothetical protein
MMTMPRRWRIAFGLHVAVMLGSNVVSAQPSEPPAPSETAAPAPATGLAPTAHPAPTRAGAEALEREHVASRSPAHLWLMASAYAALAQSGGDPWDARLALLYTERFFAVSGTRPTPEQQNTIDRLGALAADGERRAVRSLTSSPVSFLAYDEGHRYDVNAGGDRCTTPCTLWLPRGPQTLKASGDGDISADIVVPPLPSMVRLHHRSSGMRTAGALLIPLGIVVGASMWSLALTCEDSACAVGNLIAWPVAGASMLITGIVLVASAGGDPPADANRVELTGLVRPASMSPHPGVQLRF